MNKKKKEITIACQNAGQPTLSIILGEFVASREYGYVDIWRYAINKFFFKKKPARRSLHRSSVTEKCDFKVGFEYVRGWFKNGWRGSQKSEIPQYVLHIDERMRTTILMRPNVLEVAWSAIFLRQERLAVVELARSAPGALGGVGAVEVWCVTVSNVTEPKTRADELVYVNKI